MQRLTLNMPLIIAEMMTFVLCSKHAGTRICSYLYTQFSNNAPISERIQFSQQAPT